MEGLGERGREEKGRNGKGRGKGGSWENSALIVGDRRTWIRPYF